MENLPDELVAAISEVMKEKGQDQSATKQLIKLVSLLVHDNYQTDDLEQMIESIVVNQ